MTLMWLVAIKYLNSWTALAALLAFQDVAEQFPKPHRVFPYSVVYCFWQLQCSVCIPPPMTMVHLWLALHTQTHTIHTHTHTHTGSFMYISSIIANWCYELILNRQTHTVRCFTPVLHQTSQNYGQRRSFHPWLPWRSSHCRSWPNAHSTWQWMAASELRSRPTRAKGSATRSTFNVPFLKLFKIQQSRQYREDN